MKIIEVEHSPIPHLHSIKDWRLQLNKSERKTLGKACAILSEIDYKIRKWEGTIDPYNEEIDDLAGGAWCRLSEFLEEGKFWHNGYRLDKP